MVQGVGFRPFIYRIATKHGLTGWVQNTNENVRIRITGDQLKTDRFLAAMKNEAPSVSLVEEISVMEITYEPFPAFTILKSHDVSDEITEISPDIAVCNDCVEDMQKQGSRLDYPFVNCTNCGPRFSIIKDLPYDRARTTMEPFPMCSGCREEFESIRDRRFHAQPTACACCGPHYELFSGGKLISKRIDVIADRVSQCIDEDGVVLIKGLGGMHLACNAFSKAAVEKLREIKKRDGKPLAVMFRDPESLTPYVNIDESEHFSLESWRRPIVLLEMKDRESSGNITKKRSLNPVLADNINDGLNLIGVMLPYMPFHYLLFRTLKTSAIVLTSGNFSTEPILIDNGEAIDQFTRFTQMQVLHNREIYNRTDDSVVRVMGQKERLLRRSRGYVPAPVRTSLKTEGILAFGAELTNCFCIGKGHKAILSQHIGDLQGLETTQFYEQTIGQFLRLFRVNPTLLAVDMHPEYISTITAQKFSPLPTIHVQHHHAHIAACMAEHRLDEKVIGVALDGTGYGDDANIWGGEFFVCDLNNYTRVTHFDYLPLPGGDMAAEEPWRMAVSCLYKVFGSNFRNLKIPFLENIDPDKIDMLIRMIDQKINCPFTSGAGRLFDAVSALLGLCHVATYQAEGPMLLESLVQKTCSGKYEFTLDEVIRFDATIRGIVEDILGNVAKSTISAKFHNTIISVIFESSNAIRRREGINKVVLSGGVFQNKYLLEGAVTLLEKHDFEVFTHALVPTNDGGIALGQLAVASKRRELKCV